MFIGHFAAGLAAKKVAPRPSLGTLFMAAQFVDLLWPLFLLFGIEKVAIEPGNTVFTPLNFIYYPFTHSLAGTLFWALVLAVVYFIIRKDKVSALWLAVLVVSHWVLDLITHRPDLPLLPGLTEQKAGLGLWNSLAGTLLLEGALFAAGIYLYLKATRTAGRKGIYIFWSLIAFLIIVYLSNIFGPPPPSEGPLAYVGLSQWLLVAWGYWIDRNRTSA